MRARVQKYFLKAGIVREVGLEMRPLLDCKKGQSCQLALRLGTRMVKRLLSALQATVLDYFEMASAVQWVNQMVV
jgi:hypothetical protein